MEQNVTICIHGLEYDTCANCFSKPVDQVEAEVERNSHVFNWREKVFVEPQADEPAEVDYDFDYDYDMDSETE